MALVTSRHLTGINSLRLTGVNGSGGTSTDRVRFTGQTLDPNSNDFTLGMWVHTLNDGSDYGYNMTYYAQGDGGGLGTGWIYSISSTGNYTTFLGGSGNDLGAKPKKNCWEFLTMTYDADGDVLKFYVDGDLKKTVTSLIPNSATGPHFYGSAKSANLCVDGYLSKLRLFSTTLTDAQVISLYKTDEKAAGATLEGEYTFYNNSGDLKDSSGNGNDGTVTGATYDTESPFPERSIV